MAQATTRRDVYEGITASIVAAIEKGAGNWEMPWHRAGSITRPVNIASGKGYRGVNVVALWAAAEGCGFDSPTWGTYRQWQAAGAQVVKGARGSMVVFYKEIEAKEAEASENEDGEPVGGKRLMARASWVFNSDQVEGWTPKAEPVVVKSPAERIAAAEAFVAACQATIRHGGGRAFYDITADRIGMPPAETFTGTSTSTATEGYYGTLLHELTHWTRHPSRLDRDFGRKRWGDEGYAMEELVAELGAAFLCADLGIALQPRPDHAAYIASWLKVLKDDKRAIFTAASKASQAADFLGSLQTAAAQAA